MSYNINSFHNNECDKRAISNFVCYIPIIFTFLQNMHFFGFSLLTVVTIAIVLILSITNFRNTKLLLRTSIDTIIILLSVVILFSIIFSKGIQSSIEFTFIYLIGILLYYLLLNNDSWIPKFFKGLFIFALFNLVITLISFIDFQLFKSIFYRFLTNKAMIFTDSYYSKFGFHAGIMGQTGTNAIALSMGLPYLVGCISRNNKKVSYILLYILFLFGIVITGKRGAFIYALFATFFVYAIKQKKKPSSFLRIVFVIVFFMILLYFAYHYIEPVTILIDRLIPDSDSVTDLSVHRFDLYNEAISVFKQNFIVGIGIGAYPNVSAYSNNVHNDYLEAFAELGLVGGITVLLLYILPLVNSIKLDNTTDEVTESLYLITFFSLTSLTSIVFYNYGFMLILFVCIAAIQSKLIKNIKVRR